MKVENISRYKKDRFLLSMSEDGFRDKVVRPLFLRLGYEDGRDLCGPLEHGKDTIFVSRNPIGILELTAVQTKKGSLNLASRASANLANVITQLRTALQTMVVLVASKQKLRPNTVILCSSGKINETARQHILDDVRESNIQFLDSEELVPRIDKHLPELWLGIDADVLPYFLALQRRLGESDTGESESSGALSAALSDDSFVELRLFRTAVRRRKVRGQFIDTPEFIEIPLVSVTQRNSRRILILGEAGSGKSNGLKRIASEIARRRLQFDSEHRIPILLRAHDIARERASDLVQYCDDYTRRFANSAKPCFTLADLENGTVLLLVDALDEIAETEPRVFVLTQLRDFSAKFTKCQVILTARPYRNISELPQVSGFEEFRLSPISWKQAQKIVTRVSKNRKLPVATTRELLRRLEHVHGIELNPLLVTVFVATSDFDKQDVPANITELFKKFTELMLGRWDETKGLRLQHQAPLKDFVLTKLAFAMHSRRVTSIARIDAEALVTNELRLRGYESNAHELLDEIFERSGLFRIVDTDIEFRHHLLQEFFAGRGITNPDFLKLALVDEWWKRALVFYFGDNPGQVELLDAIKNAVAGVDSVKLYTAVTAIGLALQACYLSPVSAKLDVWKWVVKTLALNEEDYLSKQALVEKYPYMHFLSHYLFARDSVALTHLKANLDGLKNWVETSTDMNKKERDRAMFWLVVALVESGDIQGAQKLMRTFHPSDVRLLLAVHVGCYYAAAVRPIGLPQKKIAKEISTRISGAIKPHRDALLKEFGSLLLEVRKGKIEVIEAESPDDE